MVSWGDNMVDKLKKSKKPIHGTTQIQMNLHRYLGKSFHKKLTKKTTDDDKDVTESEQELNLDQWKIKKTFEQMNIEGIGHESDEGSQQEEEEKVKHVSKKQIFKEMKSRNGFTSDELMKLICEFENLLAIQEDKFPTKIDQEDKAKGGVYSTNKKERVKRAAQVFLDNKLVDVDLISSVNLSTKDDKVRQ